MICDLNKNPTMEDKTNNMVVEVVRKEEGTTPLTAMEVGSSDDHSYNNRSPYICEAENDGGVGDHPDDMLADINGAANLIFSDDAFPSLPDFPCLSSPSCSSSFAPCRSFSPSSFSSSSTNSSSSSSSTSWSVVKVNDGENKAADPVPAQAGSGGADLLRMELLDEELWDPSSLFPDDDQKPPPVPAAESGLIEDGRELGDVSGGGGDGTEDLAMMFFEWLKSNKETLSPEDLKSIKLKRSTIESAVRRLGGGQEGMKHLLKLILAWVQKYHLEKRRLRSTASAAAANYQRLAPPMIPAMASTNCSGPVPFTDEFCSWFPPLEPVFPGFSYGGGGEVSLPMGGKENLHAAEPISVWPPPPQHQPQYPLFTQPPPPPYVGGYGAVQYPMATTQFFRHRHGENFVRFGSSATKEARKKRMARQRRFLSLHHHRQQQQQQPLPPPQQQQQQQQQHQFPPPASHGEMTRPSITNVLSKPGPGPGPAAVQHQFMQQIQQQQMATNHAKVGTHTSSDRRQALKQEKNLRFLLQKVLKQSDVGSLGRIVLPKKEAEIHLPELDARDGIPIAMEDIGTSRTWNMRYRFWPNNKSRMYLLENTGDFVRSNGLQEGDFIVIYSDKCGKFIIRGVKVRKPADPKAGDVKNMGKQVCTQLPNGYFDNNNDDDDDNGKSNSLVEVECGGRHSLMMEAMT